MTDTAAATGGSNSGGNAADDAPKGKRSVTSAVAAWSAPQDGSDPIASFGNRADATAFAAAYGGDIEAIGTAFAVKGADVKRARDDAAKYREGKLT